MYSKQGGDVRRGGILGSREDDCSLLLACCPQSEVCRSRSVRKTFEIVNAKTLTIEKFLKRHGGDCE